MKKTLSILLLILFVGITAFANEVPFFSFKWFNSKSLYDQNPADVFSANSTLAYLGFLSGQPRTIRVTPIDGSGQYKDIPIYKDGHYSDEKAYLHLKTGANVGFIRFALFREKVALEFGLSAALNSIFQGFGGADILGYDGVYFIGPQLRLFDRVSFKVGLQHYSGHYGDETLENINKVNGVLREGIAYTRDNNLFFGLNVDILKNLHFNIEATLPMEKSWMGPAVHIPSWVLKPSNEKPAHPIVAGEENVTAVEYPDSYKAWSVQTGLWYDYSVTNQLGLSIAAIIKFHQDGMTLHTVGGYQEDNPWEKEFTLGVGVVLKDPKTDFKTRINFSYHNGRTPLLNFFYQRSSYIGFSIIMG